ncbi:DUF2993 domain-containing protein [Streptomyces sp. RFCAC02]|uniref:LmeA family phospholipid-binding protein n=1 Tax=Streptomyces sp. RFCAC02 TaxID=2499143 RepID=UPI0010229859|nr:DUF2993 domain-containing protein [Streptomyces sp. RFCAC02]
MRALRISLIIVGVLVVLGIVADRVAVSYAEGEVGSQVRDTYGLTEDPSVKIQGFPFLTQALSRELPHVDLGMDSYEATVDGNVLTVTDLEVELRDIEVESDFSGAVADRATGHGVVSYEELTRVYGETLGAESNGFGVEVAYGGEEGKVTLVVTTTVLGQKLDIGDIPGEITVADGQVTLDVDENDIPEVAGVDTRALAEEQLGTPRSVDDLPQGLELTGLVPTEEGLVAEISGSHLTLG